MAAKSLGSLGRTAKGLNSGLHRIIHPFGELLLLPEMAGEEMMSLALAADCSRGQLAAAALQLPFYTQLITSSATTNHPLAMQNSSRCG